MPDQENPNDIYGNASEDAHKNRGERCLRVLEVLGLWLAAGVGLLAVIVASLDARGQRGVMQGQLNEMQAEQRPWLRVDVIPGDFVVLDPPGTAAYPAIAFNPHFTITNVGKSPAFNAQLSFRGWSDVASRDDPGRMQAEMCGAIARNLSAERHDGRIVFPADHFDEQLGPAKADVAFMGPDFAKGLIQKNQEWPMHFKVVGCVDYLFGAPPEHHQTGFIYDVYRTGERGAFLGSEFLNSTFDASTSVPATNIRMWPGPNSALAN